MAMSITKDIWSPLLRGKIVRRTSKELTRSFLGVRTLMNPLLLRRGFPVILLALAWFTLPQAVRAVNPAPDGGYPNSNTAEGTDALFSLTTGANNTAIGGGALFYNTTGDNNTAIGDALVLNTTGSNNTASGSQALNNNTTGSYNT